ncbi:MAG: cobyric acid synthase, partial [Verrucomicrobia bacterium]|nr:cobyric acid synthase [Verrucomicrobiota bacterium]
MRALSVLGTSSNSGKSWITTALCRLLSRKGIRVAPFKAQNMSNNSFVTMEGGEIGRAQAVQAEACRIIPSALINPILLKPTGKSGSQLIVGGVAQGHLTAREFYARTEELWPVVVRALEQLRAQHDVLILEGAGSPVELNLLKRDLANLRPIRYLDAKWVLVADIERGGVFAQLAGTWQLLTREDQQRGLGMLVNKFRGDPSLFSGARQCLAERVDMPYLGVVPFREDLQPESEDSLCRDAEEGGSGKKL